MEHVSYEGYGGDESLDLAVYRSGLKKHEIIYLLFRRSTPGLIHDLTPYAQKVHFHLDSGINYSDLFNLLGLIQSEEKITIELYRQKVSSLSDEQTYPEYRTTELAVLFGVTFKHPLPFSGTYFSSNDALIGFYLMLGYSLSSLSNLSPLNTSLTTEQQYLLRTNLTGTYVVNAGPGTGKTTVANRRAHELKSEGVLLISYANKAINENYDRLRMYPRMRGILKKKDYTKDKDVICVTTVDSFAYYLFKFIREHVDALGGFQGLDQISYLREMFERDAVGESVHSDLPSHLKGESVPGSSHLKGESVPGSSPLKGESGDIEDTSFDRIIAECNRYLSWIPLLSKFNLNNGNKVCRFSHIIVDESQDIDDFRGQIILKYAKYFGVKSVCLFGDPRQRLQSNCGSWYHQIWVEATDIEPDTLTIAPDTLTKPLSKIKINNTNKTINALNPKNKLRGTAHRIGFTTTFRFHNRLYNQLVNTLSRRRPHLDVQLTPSPIIPIAPEEPIDLIVKSDENTDHPIEQVARYLQYLVKEGITDYNQIALITPSLQRNNTTSSGISKILAVFRSYSIPCYTKAEGGFLPNAILFTSIHGAKGKEFDYVLLYGCDNFPETFKMIPHDTAESLIYVMHSRARKKMFYLSPNRDVFRPPRGLRGAPYPYFQNVDVITNQSFVDKDQKEVISYKISELSSERSLHKFLDSNGVQIHLEPLGQLESILPLLPIGSARFWGILCGLAIQSLVHSDYPSVLKEFHQNNYDLVSDYEYEHGTRNGTIIDGVNNRNRLVIRQNNVNMLSDEEAIFFHDYINIPPSQISVNQLSIIAQCYDFLINGSMISREDAREMMRLPSEDQETIRLAWLDLSDKLIKIFGKPIGIEEKCSIPFIRASVSTKIKTVEREGVPTGGCIVGSIDISYSKYVLELKTSSVMMGLSDGIQSLLYTLSTGRQPLLLNLQTGGLYLVQPKPIVELESIYSGPNNKEVAFPLIWWRQLIISYTRLRTHVDEVVARKNRVIEDNLNKLKVTDYQSKGDRAPFGPLFLVDTEFAPHYHRGKLKYNIFDIAIVNYLDPYRSIVQTIRPPVDKLYENAEQWLSLPKKLFQCSGDENWLRALYRRLIGSFGVDCSEVTMSYYVCPTDVRWCGEDSELSKIKFDDISVPIRKGAPDHGFISGGKPPPLSDYYDVACYPVEHQPHIQIHTALSDTLLLYEIVHLNKV